MASSADVMVRFLADTSQVDKGVSGMTGTLKKFGSGLTSFLGGAALGAFAKTAVDAANDMGESISKVNTVFGSSAKTIQNFARGAADNLGLSRQAALDAAAAMGNMFTQLGFIPSAAADMSKGMLKLTADLASFHNADPTQVLEAVQSAFRGEYDAVQKFVPTITAAAVEHKALAERAAGVTGALTDGEKAAATYKLLMEGAGNATGDFARTSDSAANQQRIMQAKMADTTVTIGQALQPAMAVIVPLIADMATAFATAAPDIQSATIALGAFGAVALIVGGPIGLIIAAVGAVGVALFLMWTHWDEIWGWLVNHPAYAIVAAIVLAPVAAMFLIIGALKFLWDNWSSIWGWIKQATSDAVGFITGLWNGMVAFFSGIPGAIGGAFSSIWQIMTAPFRAAEATIREIFGTIRGIVEGAVGAVRDVWNPIANAINDIHIEIPKVHVIGTDIDIGGGTIDPPHIPTLAKGGIVSSATLALIGEAGPEAVVPLRDEMLGSNVYNIAIKVDAGTPPAVVGAAVVDQIRAYERVAGRAWRTG